MVITEWVVEIYADDEFDFGRTFDAYDEAKEYYDHELSKPYNWTKSFRVELYEVTKTLVLKGCVGK
jgi:hypothetical protein